MCVESLNIACTCTDGDQSFEPLKSVAYLQAVGQQEDRMPTSVTNDDMMWPTIIKCVVKDLQ